MDKQLLINIIKSGLSSYKIAEYTGKSQTTISYWLKKHDLKTRGSNKKKGERSSVYIGSDGYEYKSCPRCKEGKKISAFCIRGRGKDDYYSYCKPCLSKQKKERHNEEKRLLVEYKGGKCVCCGYDKCNSCLEFHHINPKEKDFNISQRNKRTFEETKKELDKCELVCTICHREIHAGIRKLPEKK